MKKIIVLFALISFTVGLNAGITKEEIYNTNPQVFEQLKKDLKDINTIKTDEIKQAYLDKQINDAVKLVLSNKELLKNATYAVIRNGKILKTSASKDADGLSFWHRHNPDVANPPAENTCVITNPVWDNVGLYATNDTCGWMSYQLSATSQYNNLPRPLVTPTIYLLPETDDNVIENLYPGVAYDVDLLDIKALGIHYYYDLVSNPQREIPFRNHSIVNDTIAGIVTFYNYNDMTLIDKNTDPFLYTADWDRFNTYYRPTEYSVYNQNIMTLKSGTYIPLLVTGYFMTDNWWEGFTVILKWFRVNVENYYLGDVAVEEHNQADLANIIWNNHQIKIELANSVNPANTSYELYDISGRLIKKEYLSSHQTTHNMPTLTASGVYIIRIKGKNLSLSKKIVFKK
jgi:hypothetical protein